MHALPLLCLLLALFGADRQHVVSEANLDVLFIHAGQLGLDLHFFVGLADIHVRGQHRGAGAAASAGRHAAAPGVVEQAVHFAMQRHERIQRATAHEAWCEQGDGSACHVVFSLSCSPWCNGAGPHRCAAPIELARPGHDRHLGRPIVGCNEQGFLKTLLLRRVTSIRACIRAQGMVQHPVHVLVDAHLRAAGTEAGRGAAFAAATASQSGPVQPAPVRPCFGLPRAGREVSTRVRAGVGDRRYSTFNSTRCGEPPQATRALGTAVLSAKTSAAGRSGMMSAATSDISRMM